MKRSWIARNVALVALLAGAMPVMAQRVDTPVAGAAKVPGTTLSIDDLYRFKSIVGTEPVGYSWAADGSAVLFLWNDEGATFQDVWSFSPETGRKTRLTFLGRESKPEAEAHGIGQAVYLDRGRIAFTLGGQLHVREANGTIAKVEADKQAIRTLAVSPDGTKLAFVSGAPVDPKNRVALGGVLWVRDVASGATARKLVGDDDPKVYVSDFQWSDDSRAIAFEQDDDRLMPERDILYYAKGKAQNNRVIRAFPGDETTKARIGVVTLAGVTKFYERPDPKHHIWGYGLSSDGKRLFVSGSDMEAKEHTVHVYDVASGGRETFYQLAEPHHIRPDWQVAWAPGDDGLIILTDRDGWAHLYHQKTAGAAPRAITSGQWEIASFEVDRANRQLYFLSNKSYLAERQVYRVAVAGGAVERVSGAAAGTHRPVYSPDFRYAADWFSDDMTPPELYLADLAKPGAKAVQVTKSPLPGFYEQTWAKVGYVEFPSHVDGQNLLGRVMLPANYDPAKKYPVIVGSVYSDGVQNQWGGRRAHPTWGIDQYFVAQGYIVLTVNLRGSWGQGRAHNQTQHHSYGTMDINDLESGVRYLVAKGYADPKRVGLWGSSYGGLMTIMSLAKKRGVYAAGIAGAPATNVWHAYPGQMWIMGPPTGPDMPGRYERQSPLYQVQGVKDPLMIIHGTRDPVVLYSDTVALTEKMIANQQMFELVTLPGGNHGWDNEGTVQTRFAFKKMAEFFDRHVKNK